MKATGIVRRIDDLGRLVLPIELRRLLNLDKNDAVEIFVDDDDKIVLRKYEPACIFCNSTDNVKVFRNRNICETCVDELLRK